jgi:hypothetical protein
MRLASKHQTRRYFTICWDRVFAISAVPDVTRAKQLLQIPPLAGVGASTLVLGRLQVGFVLRHFKVVSFVHHNCNFRMSSNLVSRFHEDAVKAQIL